MSKQAPLATAQEEQNHIKFSLHPASRQPLRFTYRNWRGEVAERRVEPRFIWFGATEYHPEPQWLLNAYDLDRPGYQERDFAMRDMENIKTVA